MIHSVRSNHKFARIQKCLVYWLSGCQIISSCIIVLFLSFHIPEHQWVISYIYHHWKDYKLRWGSRLPSWISKRLRDEFHRQLIWKPVVFIIFLYEKKMNMFSETIQKCMKETLGTLGNEVLFLHLYLLPFSPLGPLLGILWVKMLRHSFTCSWKPECNLGFQVQMMRKVSVKQFSNGDLSSYPGKKRQHCSITKMGTVKMSLKWRFPLCLSFYIILSINCNFRGNLRSTPAYLMSHW